MEYSPQILFSTIFVLIGSIVFHLSSLVSGYSIFRELPSHLSALGAMVVGLILFLVSPIGFLSFFPECFVSECFVTQDVEVPESGQTPQEVMGNQSNVTSKDRELYQQTFQLYLNFRFFLPFLAAAIGLGLVFGCLTRLYARESFLLWLRRRMHLHFRVYTYQQVWDGLFDSLKQDAQARITTKDKIVEGWVSHYSLRNEPRAIELRNYRIRPREEEQRTHWILHREQPKDTETNPGSIVITDSNTEMIEVDSNSFNRHYDPMPHRSQSFYTMLAALGFVLLAGSMFCTEDLVSKVGFGKVSSTFLFLTIAFLIIAAIMVVVSLVVYSSDYKPWYAGTLLSPSIYLFGCTVLIAIVAGGWYLINIARSRQLINTDILSSSDFWLLGGGSLVLVLCLVLLRKYSPSEKLYHRLKTKLSREDKPLEVLDWLFHYINLNGSPPEEFQKAIDRLKQNPEYEEIADKIESVFSDFLENYKIFDNHQVILLIKLRDRFAWDEHRSPT